MCGVLLNSSSHDFEEFLMAHMTAEEKVIVNVETSLSLAY